MSVTIEFPLSETKRICALASRKAAPRLTEAVPDPFVKQTIESDAVYLRKLAYALPHLFPSATGCHGREVCCLVGVVLRGDLCLALAGPLGGQPMASAQALSSAYAAFNRAALDVSNLFRSNEQCRHVFPLVPSLYQPYGGTRAMASDDWQRDENSRRCLEALLREEPQRYREALRHRLNSWMMPRED